MPIGLDPTTLAEHPELHSDRGLLLALFGVVLVATGYLWRWFVSDRARIVNENSRLNDLLRSQVEQTTRLVSQCTIALNNNTQALNQMAAMLTDRERRMVEAMRTRYEMPDALQETGR